MPHHNRPVFTCVSSIELYSSSISRVVHRSWYRHHQPCRLQLQAAASLVMSVERGSIIIPSQSTRLLLLCHLLLCHVSYSLCRLNVARPLHVLLWVLLPLLLAITSRYLFSAFRSPGSSAQTTSSQIISHFLEPFASPQTCLGRVLHSSLRFGQSRHCRLPFHSCLKDLCCYCSSQ